MTTRTSRVAGWAIIACSALLLFARLGHYALWGDEAGTALVAKGVLRTFDTSALVDDHNIFADDNGNQLRNLHERYVPPLQSYLAAPSLAVFGQESAWAARLPFALCGLATIILILWWAWREEVRWEFGLLLGMGLVCNVSLLLYSRQCRYYSAALLCSVAVAWLYLRWNGRRGGLVAMAGLLSCLLALNYLNYIALCVCLAADYAVWGRRERRLAVPDWLWLLLIQAVVGVIVFCIWNPFALRGGVPEPSNWLVNKLTLFWWNWRDLNRCEFGALVLLVLAPLLYPWLRDRWLLRAPLALLIYVAATTLCSPQQVDITSDADVRYLVPVIPLCIAIGMLTLCTLTRKVPWVAIPLGVLAFGTNSFQGGPLAYCGFRSTLANYIGELINPPGDPYMVTARWINEHVRNGESVWALPNPAPYPLMFHAPKAIYAWQLTEPAEPQFALLPPIHFQKRKAPDYVIAFGPGLTEMVNTLRDWNRPEVQYEQVAMIDHFWGNVYSPELYWRTFKPVTNYNRKTEAIYVFKRVTPPAANMDR